MNRNSEHILRSLLRGFFKSGSNSNYPGGTIKLSTRSRYGTRLMVDVAKYSDKGPVRIHDIANRQDISVKYLEQLIIPLKRAEFIKSVRGPKGGHRLGKPKGKITVGGIVRVLEKDTGLVPCVESTDKCHMGDTCVTRNIWLKATQAVYDILDAVTLSDLIQGKDKATDACRDVKG